MISPRRRATRHDAHNGGRRVRGRRARFDRSESGRERERKSAHVRARVGASSREAPPCDDDNDDDFDHDVALAVRERTARARAALCREHFLGLLWRLCRDFYRRHSARRDAGARQNWV